MQVSFHCSPVIFCHCCALCDANISTYGTLNHPKWLNKLIDSFVVHSFGLVLTIAPGKISCSMVQGRQSQRSRWLAVHGKCLTADILARMGWPHNPICPLCRIHNETVSRLRGVHCSFSSEVWQQVQSQFSLPSSPPPFADCFHRSWWLQGNREKLYVLHILHSLDSLEKRNHWIFNAAAKSESALLYIIVEDLTNWRFASLKGTKWFDPP